MVVDPPLVMIADRSGRRVLMIFLIEDPVRCWASREIARAAKTMVRWASIESFVR